MTTQELMCEMEALKCEKEAMVWENKWRESVGQSIAYTEDNFLILAEKFRKLVKE